MWIRFPTQLGEQNPAGFVRYAVEIMNARDRSAGLSNQVLIPVAPTIAPPEQLNVKVEADGVLLSWEGAERAGSAKGSDLSLPCDAEPSRHKRLHRACAILSPRPTAFTSTKLLAGRRSTITASSRLRWCIPRVSTRQWKAMTRNLPRYSPATFIRRPSRPDCKRCSRASGKSLLLT